MTNDALNYWGGQWRTSKDVRERANPANPSEIVTRMHLATAQDVSDAVEYLAANRHEWATTAPEKRADVLIRAAALMEAVADELAEELVREEGKTLREARTETGRTPQNLRMYASMALTTSGRTFATAGSTLVQTILQPVGVVAAITPWNFPLNIPSRKLGPALAAGNAIVLKPSEVTPWMAHRFVEILLEAGVPAGALALLHGEAEVGDALVRHEGVDAVTFTGSTTVGEAIHRAAPMTTRCQLEMGGKNALLVADDADLTKAADIVVKGAFGLSGQACTGTSRVIVSKDRQQELETALVSRLQEFRVGDGLADRSTMGPLATQAQVDKFNEYLEVARDSGAREVELSITSPEDGGWFVNPAIFADVDPQSRLAQEEVFGPLLAIIPVADEDEGIEVVNNTSFGLSAGIVTPDTAKALAFAQRAEAGLIKVNQPTNGMAMNAPFGGVKMSSTQTFKEQAGDTLMPFYTIEKTLYISS